MSDINRRLRDFDPGAEPEFVPSPCIGLCLMNAQTGWCEGCLRTIEEIVAWGSATDADKRAVWVELKRRAADAAADGAGK